MKTPDADTSQLDAAYDTLRDEDRRRAYDKRGAGSGAAPARGKAHGGDDGFEHVKRGSGEVQEWAQSAASAGGDGKSEALSLANVAGLLSEAVSGGRLCATFFPPALGLGKLGSALTVAVPIHGSVTLFVWVWCSANSMKLPKFHTISITRCGEQRALGHGGHGLTGWVAHRFDEYLAQATTAYTGTRILAKAGGLPHEEEDKKAMADMYEVPCPAPASSD